MHTCAHTTHTTHRVHGIQVPNTYNIQHTAECSAVTQNSCSAETHPTLVDHMHSEVPPHTEDRRGLEELEKRDSLSICEIGSKADGP